MHAKLSYQVIQLGFFYSAKHIVNVPNYKSDAEMSGLQSHRSLGQVAENIMSNYLPAV